MRLLPTVLLALVMPWSTFGQTYMIYTEAGTWAGFFGDNGPATSAQLNYPLGVAVDSAGHVYIADTNNNRIRKVSNGVITTVAGNGTEGYSGDGGPATSAQLRGPWGVAVDSAGNLYIADAENYRIRKVSNGVITTVAGNGSPGFSGDNGPATSAKLNYPNGVVVDSAGQVYIADTDNHCIRRVSNGVITTVAGNGAPGFSGDNGPATSARLRGPEGVGVDSAGSLYITDSSNYRIRKVSNGVISSVAGNGTEGYSGDDGPATNAELDFPNGVAADSSGNLYIADTGNNRIRILTATASSCTYSASPTTLQAPASGGNLTVSIQTGASCSCASCSWTVFGLPDWITVSGAASGTGSAMVTLVVAPNSGTPLSVTILIAAVPVTITQPAAQKPPPPTTYVIYTAAGAGPSYDSNSGYSFGTFGGDNGPATSAKLNYPYGVAVDPAGNLYISDTWNNRIRKVSNGVVTTVAGTGPSRSSVDDPTVGTFGGDDGPAVRAQLSYPTGVAVDSAGHVYIADTSNQRIRRISNGLMTTVAGNGAQGFGGDNGPATNAWLNHPYGVAVDSAGNLYIADYSNNCIRKVTNGVITTVAGNGTPGFSGDNGPATSAQLNYPTGVAVDSAGQIYIADVYNSRIRKVSDGVITTVAGNGKRGFDGDNGSAVSAQLDGPNGVAVDSAGNLYIADTNSHRIRKVSDGVITTVAGNGTPGFSGDNGPAASAELACPGSIAVDSAGNVNIADTCNNRIRALTPCTYSLSLTTLQAPASGGNLNVSIQTGASCPWAVSGLPGWITVSGASSGAGSATVNLLVAPNSGATLSATISIAGVWVTVTQPAAPLPTVRGVTNAASYATGAVSPGELVTIFGTAIGPATAAGATSDAATGKLATTIGGMQVLFNGIAAPMIYASSTQVSAVVPYEMASVVSPSVWIKYLGQTSNAYQLTTVTTAPGLFTQNASGSGPGSILNQDYSVNRPSNPAAKGSVVMVYLTGEGQTSPPSATGAITTATLPPPQVTPAPLLAVGVLINGQPASYVYAGEAPGLVAGMMQLNVQIPSTAPSGDLPITVSIGGNTSQKGVTVSVQ